MHLVQEIGSYAGFAAVVGLAILSALYFSQARDVKRLREWAGRAPERAVEQEARVTAQAQQRAAASGGGPAVAPSPVRPQPAPAPPTTVSPGAQPPPTTIPGTRPAPAPTTPILGSMNEPEPWYRRIHWPAPRYIALIVVGILVLGAGAAYGVSQLGNNNSSTTGTPSAVSGGGASGSTSHTKHTSKKTAPAINPKSITVAVLNGTTVTGLAATMADKVEQAGFTRGNTTNALTQGQQAESVVEYSRGNKASAQLVARKLGIGQIQQIDPQTQTVAGDATVTVIVGADKANGSG
jgi:LytR cell envelope-related transcriptional attenuator